MEDSDPHTDTRSAAYREAVTRIEDHAAEMLDGLSAAFYLEAALRAQLRTGCLDRQEFTRSLRAVNTIRRAIDLGERYRRRVQRYPLEL